MIKRNNLHASYHVPDFLVCRSGLHTSKGLGSIPPPKVELVSCCNQQHMIAGVKRQRSYDCTIRWTVYFAITCLNQDNTTVPRNSPSLKPLVRVANPKLSNFPKLQAGENRKQTAPQQNSAQQFSNESSHFRGIHGIKI